jgi:hypothetical protein
VAAAPFDALTSPGGALALATAALLLVLGLRLARPRGPAGWAAAVAYAASLAATLLGALHLLPGRAFVSPLPLRVAGAAAVVVGLLTAGAPARRRRPVAERGPRVTGAAYAGLALVLLGQLLRAPSAAGALGVGVAALVHGWAAWSGRRAPGGV